MNTNDISAENLKIKELIEKKDFAEALHIAMDLLDVDANDVGTIFQVGTIMLEDGRHGLAYNILARACKLGADIPEVWVNFGRAHPDTPEGWPKSMWCFRKAIKLAAKRGKELPNAWANMALLSYISGDYDKALEYADKAISLEPKNKSALVSRGFTYLCQGRFREAWPLYRIMLETGKREHYVYGDEPEWDGTPGKRVVVSGEQGIGDELMYASCFPDLIRDSAEVVIDCMPRLMGLFKRSFPEATVYGTRWDKEVVWERDHNPEAHVAMATLPRFYRNHDDDFPGTPYLKPHPEMALSFKRLLDSLGPKPKVGIAWTGGIDQTRGYLRTRTLDELTPILRQDVTWVSLEYHDREQEIAEYREKRNIEIHTFPWITAKGLDYDLTAALVANLDLVITVPTTVSQMAGALGVDCWVIAPKHTGWIFARDVYPWAHSTIPLKNPSMKEMEEKLIGWLKERDIKAA